MSPGIGRAAHVTRSAHHPSRMALGPAGEVLRLWGDRVDEIRPTIAAEIHQALAEFERPDGVFAPASTWIVGARAPQA